MYILTPLGKLQKFTRNGVDNWIKNFSSVWLFLLQVLLVRSIVGTTESTDIPYVGVKVNLFEQIEYQRKFQDVVVSFPGEEQISSLTQPLFQ